MKHRLHILLLGLMLSVGAAAEEHLVIQGINSFDMVAGHNEDTVFYYVTNAFVGMPRAQYVAAGSTDSVTLTPTIVFEDCAMQYRWFIRDAAQDKTVDFTLCITAHETTAIDIHTSYVPSPPPGPDESIEQTELSEMRGKRIENGHIVILRQGTRYSIIGTQL